MQHAWKHVERPGGSHTALDGKKIARLPLLKRREKSNAPVRDLSKRPPVSTTSNIEIPEQGNLHIEATRWLSWYGVGLASADRLPAVVRIPAGPLGSLKCDPPKGNGRRPQKKGIYTSSNDELSFHAPHPTAVERSW